jgi:shikimate kinase
MARKRKHIFLVGFMGVGKSTMARKMAHKLNYSFVDTDKFIEHKYQTSVADIIASSGIDVFRKIEHEVLRDIVLKDQCVTATGGGMPCYYNNMETIKKSGLSIYISFPPELIFHRLRHAKVVRPLVKDLNDEALMAFIRKTLEEREQFYRQADVIIEDRSIRTEKLLRIAYDYLAS